MPLPEFPRPLARLIGRLPAWPASAAFAAALNHLVWGTLRAQDCSVLLGRCYCVHVSDLGVRTFFSLGRSGFRPLGTGSAEVTFTATARDFLRLALRQEDPDSLFFNRRLRIEGDTDLGLAAKNVMDSLDIEALATALPGWLRDLLFREACDDGPQGYGAG